MNKYNRGSRGSDQFVYSLGDLRGRRPRRERKRVLWSKYSNFPKERRMLVISKKNQ